MAIGYEMGILMFTIKVFGSRRQLTTGIILKDVGKEEELTGCGLPAVGARMVTSFKFKLFIFHIYF
jgi:hypothetical protein